MKKLFALLLAMMMIFSLAACGDNNTTDPDKDNPGVSQSGENNDDKGGENNDDVDDPYSLAAFERVLKAVNLELSDIEPGFEWNLKSNYHVYGEDPTARLFKGNLCMTKENGEVTDDEYRAWVEKLFAATAAASDDGYNIVGGYFDSEGEDPEAQVTLEKAMTDFVNIGEVQGWAFRVGEETISVYPSREYDNSKDSEIGAQFYYYGVMVKIHD